jgi:hypothetical protein
MWHVGYVEVTESATVSSVMGVWKWTKKVYSLLDLKIMNLASYGVTVTNKDF